MARNIFNNCAFIVCILTSLIYVSTESVPRNTQADLIIQGLENESWLDDEKQCVQDTLNILYNVKNHTLWAVWIWNSMQSPTGAFYGSRYNLGNYDQCLKAPSVSGDPYVLTQYCLVDVKLTEEEGKKKGEPDAFAATNEFFKTTSKVGRSFNIISWGTCLPASCNPHAVTKVVKTMYSVNPLAAGNPDFTIEDCQVAGEKTVYSTQYYVFLTVMASLVIVAITSTIYLQYVTNDTRMTRVAYSFSLQRNWSSLTRTTGNEIPFISFAKFFHCAITTICHTVLFLIIGAVGNSLDFDENFIEKEFMLGNLLQHIDLPSLENFFVISGLLVMKNLMEGKIHPMISLIQRYIRLIGSFTFLVFYTIAVSKYTGDGPLWNKLTRKVHKACEENWIWNLLMVNNYVNNENICQLVTWYVPCDYQLAIMGTALYCLWKWNKRVGKVTTILASFLALALPGIATYSKQLPGILLYDIGSMVDPRRNVVFFETYMKSHHRAGPYLIGMAMGYILVEYNPAKYKRVISRGWSFLGIILASVISLRVWTSAAAWCLRDYNAWDSAIYSTFNRNIWALSTCLIMGMIVYGDIPAKIQSIIGWPGFVILNRLSYGVYITHSVIIQRNTFSNRNPMLFDVFTSLVTGLGVLLASLLCAVLLWLFVEAPLCNLTNLILAPSKRTGANGIKNENNPNGQNRVHEIKNGKHL